MMLGRATAVALPLHGEEHPAPSLSRQANSPQLS